MPGPAARRVARAMRHGSAGREHDHVRREPREPGPDVHPEERGQERPLHGRGVLRARVADPPRRRRAARSGDHAAGPAVAWRGRQVLDVREQLRAVCGAGYYETGT